MAFLDDLKKEAEAQKQHELQQTQSKLVAVSQSFLLVQKKYKEVHHYLLELVNQLNVLNLELNRSYYIEGFGMIDNFRPRDYALSIDSIRIGHKDFANTLMLRFKCVTDKTITVERNVPAQIDNLKDYLWQNNLKYQCTEYKNERGIVSRAIFNITSEIPISIRFSADFENAKIFIQMKNFGGLTVNEYIYAADEIGSELLDEMAKYLIDKPNVFRDLGRHQQSMREFTRQARQSKEVNYAQSPAAAAADDDEDEEKSASFFDRLKSILT